LLGEISPSVLFKNLHTKFFLHERLKLPMDNQNKQKNKKSRRVNKSRKNFINSLKGDTMILLHQTRLSYALSFSQEQTV